MPLNYEENDKDAQAVGIDSILMCNTGGPRAIQDEVFQGAFYSFLRVDT